MPNGAKRKKPASRSSRLAKMLAESKLGTQSQSTAPSGAISAPVWQLERKAYSAIGGNELAIWKGPGSGASSGAWRPSPLAAGLMA